MKISRQVPKIMALALLVLLPACTSAPSSAEVGDYLRDRVKDESEGRLRLADFRKVDGQEGEFLGVRVYSMEYQAEIEVLEDGFWAPRYFGALSFKTMSLAENSIWLGIQGFKRVAKGDRTTLSGSFTFEKTERGWKGPGGRYY